MQETLATPDRRQRRRQESIEEVLDVALELMAEQGVAGLSLGEVARRLGIRPPSLYVYFASKNALYDAEFARGARGILAAIEAATPRVLESSTSLAESLLELGTVLVGWAIDNPVYSQLLFWRPVPGFVPSDEAYRPAIDLVDLSTETFAEMQRRGWMRDDILAADVLRDWTIVIAGIVSQQLSNAPDDSVKAGRFTSALPSVVAMFANQYAAPKTATRQPAKTAKPAKPAKTDQGNRHADKR
jgi:AcrR family transcriptional regulator